MHLHERNIQDLSKTITYELSSCIPWPFFKWFPDDTALCVHSPVLTPVLRKIVEKCFASKLINSTEKKVIHHFLPSNIYKPLDLAMGRGWSGRIRCVNNCLTHTRPVKEWILIGLCHISLCGVKHVLIILKEFISEFMQPICLDGFNRSKPLWHMSVYVVFSCCASEFYRSKNHIS